jgi:lysophospholipase L1-like esterase
MGGHPNGGGEGIKEAAASPKIVMILDWTGSTSVLSTERKIGSKGAIGGIPSGCLQYMSSMNRTFRLSVPLLFSLNALASVPPTPRVSAGKTLQANPTSNAAFLNDGKFGSAWNYSTGSWAAVKLGAGPTKVLVNWNDASVNWSDVVPSSGACNNGTTYPSAYRILTSSNSTNGSDGTWDTLGRVTGNVVAGRSHVIEFAGASWLKMLVVSGSGRMDELEVYDASNGASDSWFFMGTSISQMTFKSPVPDSNFSDLVHARVPSNTPSFVRGGVPCINSSQVLSSITTYLDAMAGIHFLAIEMGTNDAWGGGDGNLAKYVRNMQAIIDSAKARGMEPILARVLSTDSTRTSGKWQVHPGYPKAIDSLAKKNKLIMGPNLDSMFRAHPELLNADGVHPSPAAAQIILRMWADAMTRNVYMSSASVSPARRLRIVRAAAGSDALGRPSRGQAHGGRLDGTGAKLNLSTKPTR